MKKIAKPLILLALASWLPWSQPVLAKENKITIGAVYLDTQGYYAGVRWGVQNAAKEEGQKIELIETNAQGDVAKESSFIDTMLSRQVNAMVLSAVSENGSVRAIRRAHQAKIPVVCYNTCINEEGVDKYIYSYLVGDPKEFGRKMGHIAADYFEKNKITEPKIAFINCEAFEVCVQRRLGFEEILKQRVPGMKVVANQEGTVLDKAISVGEKLLISHPDLDAIVGESGGATLGGVRAIRNQGYIGKTVVFGADMTTDIAQELVKNEILKGIVDISGKKMGTLVFEQAMNAINNVTPKEKIIQVPIDGYLSVEDGKNWIDTHQDGLP